MLVTQLLMNLGIYGGIPFLLLIIAFLYGNKIASGQAELDKLKSELELKNKIHDAEKKNQELEATKNAQIKKLNDTSNAGELIRMLQSFFK